MSPPNNSTRTKIGCCAARIVVFDEILHEPGMFLRARVRHIGPQLILDNVERPMRVKEDSITVSLPLI